MYVLYGTTRLDLGWLPSEVPVVLVHNDRRLNPATVTRKRVQHIFSETNVGFGAAANVGVGAVATDRAVLINPDTQLEPVHWQALESANNCELVTLRLVEGDGTPTVTAAPYPTPLRLVLSAYRLGRFAPRSGVRGRFLMHSTESKPILDAWLSGAVLSIPVAPFRAVGGFDERFFLYYEDVDLCARLAKQFPSMTVRVASSPPAVHQVGGTAKLDADRAFVSAERAASAHRYAVDQTGLAWRLAAAATRGHEARIRRRAPPATANNIPGGVVIVTLGRNSAMGERRRVTSWVRIAEQAGLAVSEVRLLDRCRTRVPSVRQVLDVARGSAAPETLSWSPSRLRSLLANQKDSLVIYVSARAFLTRPDVGRATVLDFVDRLSVSYRDRSAIATNLPGKIAFGFLAHAHARVEARADATPARRVAAGVEDALALSADWVPIIVEPTPRISNAPDVDVLFVGTLDYPPNVVAIEELALRWPAILALRPGTTALIAGARPTEATRRQSAALGWELIGDFGDPDEIYRRGRLAVAPLRHAAGIQTKVIDAAGRGLAQVVYPPAVAGLPLGFPAALTSESNFATVVVGLLEDQHARQRMGEEGRQWTRENLAPNIWAPWLLKLSAREV